MHGGGGGRAGGGGSPGGAHIPQVAGHFSRIVALCSPLSQPRNSLSVVQDNGPPSRSSENPVTFASTPHGEDVPGGESGRGRAGGGGSPGGAHMPQVAGHFSWIAATCSPPSQPPNCLSLAQDNGPPCRSSEKPVMFASTPHGEDIRRDALLEAPPDRACLRMEVTCTENRTSGFYATLRRLYRDVRFVSANKPSPKSRAREHGASPRGTRGDCEPSWEASAHFWLSTSVWTTSHLRRRHGRQHRKPTWTWS